MVKQWLGGYLLADFVVVGVGWVHVWLCVCFPLCVTCVGSCVGLDGWVGLVFGGWLV